MGAEVSTPTDSPRTWVTTSATARTAAQSHRGARANRAIRRDGGVSTASGSSRKKTTAVAGGGGGGVVVVVGRGGGGGGGSGSRTLKSNGVQRRGRGVDTADGVGRGRRRRRNGGRGRRGRKPSASDSTISTATLSPVSPARRSPPAEPSPSPSPSSSPASSPLSSSSVFAQKRRRNPMEAAAGALPLPHGLGDNRSVSVSFDMGVDNNGGDAVEIVATPRNYRDKGLQHDDDDLDDHDSEEDSDDLDDDDKNETAPPSLTLFCNNEAKSTQPMGKTDRVVVEKDDDDDDDDGQGAYRDDGPSASSPVTTAPMCWGWFPRYIVSRSPAVMQLPTVALVSDESGGSWESAALSVSVDVGGWWYGQRVHNCDGGEKNEHDRPRVVSDSGSSLLSATTHDPTDEADDGTRLSQRPVAVVTPSAERSNTPSRKDSFDNPEATDLFSSQLTGSSLARIGENSPPLEPRPEQRLALSWRLDNETSRNEDETQFRDRDATPRRNMCSKRAESSALSSLSLARPPQDLVVRAGRAILPDIACEVGDAVSTNAGDLCHDVCTMGCPSGLGKWDASTVANNGWNREKPLPSPKCNLPPPSQVAALEVARRQAREKLMSAAAQCEHNGDHASALKCYEKCLVECRQHSQATDESVSSVTPFASLEKAEVLHRIGVVRWKEGLYQDSVTTLKESLALYQNHMRPPHPCDTNTVIDPSTGRQVRVNVEADALAGVLNSLGRVHLSKGECGRAMRCYLGSLSIQETVYADPSDFEEGDDHSASSYITFDTFQTGAESKSSCITSSSSLCDGTCSKKSKATKRLLASHPEVARTVIAIGMVHEARGNYAKSIRRYRSGLKSQRRALGPDHVDVAATLNAMGNVHEKVGGYDVAERCYEEALRIYRLHLGDAHVDTAVTLNNLGQVHYHRGGHDAAMGCFVDALRIMRAVLGDSHRNVAATLHNVGLVYSARGKHDRALKVYREVLRAQRATLGDGHVDVAVTLDSIAESYDGKGRYDRALKFYSKALRVRRSALGRTHAFVAVTLERIGRFHLEREGNIGEAARRLREARELYIENNRGGSAVGGSRGGTIYDTRVKEMDELLDRCEKARMCLLTTQRAGNTSSLSLAQ